MKYTITLKTDKAEAEAYIDSRFPLTGDEPVVAERLKALDDIIQSNEDSPYSLFTKKRISKEMKADE